MIKVEDFFTNKQTVAVALSGGKDSMALLRLLYNSLEKGKVKAINVEHGIRGEESLKDTRFVKDYCKKLGVELLCFNADCVEFSKQNGYSLEEGARLIRYSFFEKAIKEGFCDVVATAHHLSDSVETVLFNLFRGAGSLGASGIKNRENIVRPLTSVTREEIDLYIHKNQIPFVTDSTNLDQKYTRNYIRESIVPQIKARFPEMEKAVMRFSKIVKEQDDFILELAEKQLIFCNGEISFKEDLPLAVKHKCVTLALKKLGLEKDYEYRHSLEVDKLSDRKNGDAIDFPKGIKCVKDYGKITFYKEPSNEKLHCQFSLGESVFGERKLYVDKKEKQNFLTFDLDKLPKDCVIRTRQEGDTFTPFNGKNKKLKKYLIDKKIPSRIRDKLLLVASQSEVYIIVGVEISDKIKVQKGSNVYYIGESYEQN